MPKRPTCKWHELSGPEVAELAAETDVAILSIGCVEMHGPHLPTGTDAIQAEGMAQMIAEREAAIILPTLYLNINDEMVGYPGTIALSPELMSRLYEELCREAARNGFTKIIFLIAHGGSEGVTRFVHHSFLHRRLGEDLGICVFDLWLYATMPSEHILESAPRQLGHGGGKETSLVMLFRPELVHLDSLDPLPAGQGPYYPKTVVGTWYTIDWTRQVPRGYIGIPQVATAEKGAMMAEAAAEACAEIVRRVKRYDPASGR